MNAMPLKSVGNSSVLVGDIGKAVDSGALQYNIVRIDGQRSVYVPIFKQGGNSNTITIVDGIKAAIKKLVDIPESLKTSVVFDQSIFVKLAISNVVREATIGLVLTGVMILIFLGSPRATVAVLLSVPLSMLVCLVITNYMGGSINTMILGGLALVFSRLIDNGVIVLENIFRHMEMGERPTWLRRKAEPKSPWPCSPPRSPPPSCSSRSRSSTASASTSSRRWRSAWCSPSSRRTFSR